MAALFDLDGVLIDTEGIYSEFWGMMSEKYQVGVDNFAQVIKGTTLTQILNKYFPEEKHPEIIEILNDFEDKMVYRIYPGVIEYLKKLKGEGQKCAIVTSSNNAKLQHLWQQHPDFKQYFDAIITDADVQRSKPDPQGYLIAAERLGAKPEDCTVYEDSYNGLIAGRRSGARVVALSTTNPVSTLEEYADLVIPSFESLLS